MAGAVEARLKALDLTLPEVAAPVANYVPFLHQGGQLFISGQLPMQGGRMAHAGKVGAAARKSKIVKLFQPVKEGKCDIVSADSPAEAASLLAQKLRENKVI